MTEREQKAVRAYCAFLLTEYGFVFSPLDPVIPALYTMHKEVDLLKKSNSELATLVEEASSKINPVVYQFNSKGEAWRFQMGIAVKWILFGALFGMLAWIAVWYWSMKNEIDQVRIMNETFQTTAELNKRVKTQDGVYYIDFTAAKGDSTIYFTEFRKLNAKTVRVYLGKESK